MKRLVHPIRYHIPTFDEIVTEGTANASRAIGRELIELLRSNNLKYLSDQEFYDISELIGHDGFDEETEQRVRNLLIPAWDQHKQKSNM